MKHAQDDLVWIDSNGVAHPLGDAATRRMKQRVGAFRMFPSPDHLVFMRYTGEDGRRDQDDGRVIRLAGEIAGPGTLCDIVSLLSQAGWRGELMVLDGDARRSVFFDAGLVQGAISNHGDERLGQILFKYGAIESDDIPAIMGRAYATRERFGVCAVKLELLSDEELFKFLAHQVEEIVFKMLTAHDGMYCFLDGYDDAAITFPHSVSATNLLMDCVTRMDEMQYFRPRIPSSEHVPDRLASDPDVSSEFATVWAYINGDRSVEDIGRESRLGEFEVTKQLYKLAQSKLVAILPPRLRGGAAEVLEVTNAILLQVHEQIDAVGHGTRFREALRAFAAGPYDTLFAHAGPFDDGSLGSEQLLKNAAALVGAGDLQDYVKEWLYEYCCFAVFSAGATLGSGVEAQLNRHVDPMLRKLRPPGGSSASSMIRLAPDESSELSFSDL